MAKKTQAVDKVFDRYSKYRTICEPVMEEQHKEARLDQLFYHGKAKALTLGLYTEEGTRAIVNINDIRPVVNAVSGLFRQTRREIGYNARVADDEVRIRLSEVMKSGAAALRTDAELEVIESDLDKTLLQCGIAPVELAIHFRSDPQGSLIAKVIDPTKFYYDPNATMRNLRDAEYLWYKESVPVEAALAMFPGTVEEDFETVTNETNTNTKERSKANYSSRENGNRKATSGSVYVICMQWRELETVRIYNNPAFELAEVSPELALSVQQTVILFGEQIQQEIEDSGDYAEGFETDFDPYSETLIIPEKYADMMEAMIESFGTSLEYDTRERWCYYTAFLGKERSLKSYKSLHQDGFSILIKTDTYDPDSRTWYGLVRQMREPSLYLRKTMTEMLYILASRSKSGVTVETDAMYDKEEFEQLWAKNDAVIEVPPGANINGKIKPKNEGGGATGYEAAYGIFQDLTAKSVGLNMSFLGMDESDKISGVLEAQRIRQVTNVLADITDSISMFQRDEARLLECYIKFLVTINNSFTVAVAGAGGKEEILRITREIVDIDYGIELGEVQLSPAMKESKYIAIKDLAFGLLQVGNPVLMPKVAEQLEVFGYSKGEILSIIKLLEPQPPSEEEQAIKLQQLQLEIEGKQAENASVAAFARNKDADTAKKGVEIEKTAAEIEQTRLETALASSVPIVPSVNI